MSETLEWWPDYGAELLFLRAGPGGNRVDPATLGLTTDLCERLSAWYAEYSEDKLPIDADGDAAWLETGRTLLHETRNELRGRYAVVVTEPWWGEPPTD
jgi:hypothetical protein